MRFHLRKKETPVRRLSQVSLTADVRIKIDGDGIRNYEIYTSCLQGYFSVNNLRRREEEGDKDITKYIPRRSKILLITFYIPVYFIYTCLFCTCLFRTIHRSLCIL